MRLSKKKTGLILCIALALGVVCGVGAYFGVAYIEGGGTVDGALDYIEVTVLPALVSAGTFVVAAYIASRPLIDKGLKLYANFKAAKEDIGSVSESGTQMISLVNELKDELKTVIAENGDLNAELSAIRKDFEGIKKAITIGFGNTAELVRNGYAKQIVDAMEGKDEEKG